MRRLNGFPIVLLGVPFCVMELLQEHLVFVQQWPHANEHKYPTNSAPFQYQNPLSLRRMDAYEDWSEA